MKNKILKLILALCFVMLPCAIMLSGCFGGGHTCEFKENPIRIAEEATCQHRTLYYKVCDCGKTSHETFEYGELGQHNYDYISNGDGTHTKFCYYCHDGLTENYSSETASCESPAFCQFCGNEYESKIPHSFTNYVSNGDATCEHDGTKTAHCENCGLPDTIVDEGSKFGHDYEINPYTFGKHTKYCKNCYENVTENCYGGTATCSSQAICEACHECYGTLHAHSYNSNNTCTICNTKKGSSGLEFSLNYDGKYYILVGIGSCTDENLIIPDTYENLPVKCIYDRAFYQASIKTVTIPYSIKLIETNAFEGCSSLEGVYISSLETWLEVDFENDLANPLLKAGNLYLNNVLVEELTIPESVTQIKKYAFNGCTSIKSVVIHDGLTSFEEAAFSNCSPQGVYISSLEAWLEIDFASVSANPLSVAKNLYLNNELVEELTIPESVTQIKKYAFSGCTSIKSVVIHDGITSIGVSALDCYYLEDVYISSIESWLEIDFASVSANPLSLNNNLYLNNELVEEFVIPEGTTQIKNYALCGRSSIKSVVIPSTVTSMGRYVFENCALLKIYIPNIETWLNMNFVSSLYSRSTVYNFYLYVNGELLENLEIPSGFTEIKDYAFSKNCSLKSVSIPEGVTKIGLNAFYLNDDLESISFPNSLRSIDQGAFYWCTSLTNITIPEGIRTIPNSIFGYCTSLTKVTLPESVTTIGEDAFTGCSKLETIIIPGKIEKIHWQAFSNTGNNLKNITLGNAINLKEFNIPTNITGVTILGGTEVVDEAFKGYSKIKTINLPNTITSIGNSAFEGCSNLNTLTIPKSVTSIGSSAFKGCTCLNSATISEGVTTIGSSLFEYSGLLSIVIPEGVTKIEENAFNGCGYLQYVTIPGSVTSIEENAFDGCTSIKGVYISSLESWLNINFENSSSNPLFKGDGYLYYLNKVVIEDITIPSGITEIKQYAFYFYSHLKSVVIPEGVTTIGNSAFAKSTISELTISNTVTSIGNSVFKGCQSLKNLTIPSSVTCIGAEAFNEAHIEYVTFEDTQGWALYKDLGGENEQLIGDVDVTDAANNANELQQTTDSYNLHWAEYYLVKKTLD